MTRIKTKHHRVMAIAPSTRGFGFAVLEGHTLVDWGVKSVKGDKNSQCMKKLEKLIAQYEPEVIVLQDYSAKGSRRSARIRELGRQIVALASSRKLKVAMFSRERVMRAFFADGQVTKHTLAEVLAKRFPNELGFRLPPKRQPWMSEDSRMDIFEAVALALMLR
jgi:Holliday junction resolvasome RuvABC endonuclease subunit